MKHIMYKLVRFIGRPLLKIVYRPTVIGKNNIPLNGPIILAGNHTKTLDAALMIGIPPRMMHTLAKKELFKKKLGNLFFTSMNCIPVDRSKKDKKATSKAEEILKNGHAIGIFPEGTVNKTNQILLPFKYGAVSLAKKTNSYIVPFAITGKYKIFRKNIKIEFDKPYKVLNENLEIENNILMNKIEKMIRKDNKNEHNKKRRQKTME